MNDQAKKEQKFLEKIIKEIIASEGREKSKSEACLRLIEVFENCLEVNINFDFILKLTEDLFESQNLQSNKIWLMLVIQIIKFRYEYRDRLFSRMMKIVFQLKNDDTGLMIKVNQLI